MTRAPQLLSAAVLLGLVGLIWVVLAPSHPLPHLDGPLPDRVEVVVADQVTGREVAIGSARAPADLIDLMRHGSWIAPHACMARGRLLLTYGDGRRRELGLMSGHRDGWYEFSLDGQVYAVGRSEFFSVLERLGIDCRALR